MARLASKFETADVIRVLSRWAGAIRGIRQKIGTLKGQCCTNLLRVSLCEFGMIAGRHEQLSPSELQNHELVVLQ